jgi:Tfp pilus assembly protein PilP
MKLMTSILAVGMMTSGGLAQNPNIIKNVQGTMQGVQQRKTNDSNAALGIPAPPSGRPMAQTPGTPGINRRANGPAVTGANPMSHAAQVHAAPRVRRPAGPHTVIAAQEAAPKTGEKAVSVVAATTPSDALKTPVATQTEEKKWAMSGKRDPFFSPIVQQSSGSGCSTGKKCLEIGQINVRGVVKSENGFIAVVTNGLNKAYFLRENDPVFNGYVIRITGDTVVFKETVQDKLGKQETHEVVKRILTPAV